MAIGQSDIGNLALRLLSQMTLDWVKLTESSHYTIYLLIDSWLISTL